MVSLRIYDDQLISKLLSKVESWPRINTVNDLGNFEKLNEIQCDSNFYYKTNVVQTGTLLRWTYVMLMA